jgi:hypothetical protein
MGLRLLADGPDAGHGRQLQTGNDYYVAPLAIES